jgi:hypothetical protein
MQLGKRIRSLFEPRDAAAQAEMTFRSLWATTARAGSTRHPFHREVLTDLDMLLDQVYATPPDTLVRVRDVRTRWDQVERLYPYIARRLTPDWMRSFVVAEVDRVAAVADSDDYLTAHSRGWEGDQSRMLVVQHRLSGLRAAFLWDEGSRTGRVFAKSYSIRSIDPRRDWEHEGSDAVDQWQGLGITSRLYLHGAALLPELRWGITTLTHQSAAMRRRLHGIDPWRFAAADDPEWHPHDTCLWCLERGWARLDSTHFEAHPPWPAVEPFVERTAVNQGG